MKVKYIEKSDFPQWDAFVNESPQGFIWDYSWWVEIITDGDFKICVVEGDDKKIMAGIVLPFISSKRIIEPGLTQAMGILFYDPANQNNIRLQKNLTNQKEYTNMIFDFIAKDVKVFRMRFHYNYDYWLPLYWRGYCQTTMYTYIIDYEKYDFEEEFKHFSKGHKWTLNKVEKKSDLNIVQVYDVEEYLRESVKTYRRQGTKRPYSDNIVRKLHNAVSERGMGTIFKIVDKNGKIHAIEYYLHNDKEAYYWLGASDSTLRDSGGHTYLTWYAIRYFADKVRVFNFGGSMIEYVERNFRNFSAIPKQYFNISYCSTFERIKSLIKSDIRKLVSK